ncbi:MAG: hypothetical protein MUE94_00815 [Verrucomicrobia bacterium]|jgi:hypothetical protein|nr:hypothetical protein [Verrucomicrobiota bacterium]
MNDWNIQSRAHACSACEQPFADQAPYHTALFEDPEGLHRRDVCRRCWEADVQAQRGSRPGFVSHWQGIYEAPPPVTESIQKENAESLLRKLIGQDDPRYIPAGYILAVMLERKRILKVKEEWQREGRRVFVYEHARSGDVFTIVDPDLQLDQLESVQREVSQLLEHGLNPPPAPQTAPDESGPAVNPAQPVAATAAGGQPA